MCQALAWELYPHHQSSSRPMLNLQIAEVQRVDVCKALRPHRGRLVALELGPETVYF